MSNNTSIIIETELQKIVGLRFVRLNRMAATGSIGFGDIFPQINRKGQTVNISQFVIHSSCCFRIIDKNSCFLANLDMFVPNSATIWSETFDWDISGANLFDEKAKKINEEIIINSIIVVNVSSNIYGDLFIELSNGWTIQIIDNNSSVREAWRFFDCISDANHFVFTGQGIESPEESL